MSVRFDDMIATVLDRPSSQQRAVAWRQLVDLLAQGRHGAGAEQVERAFAFLRAHRDDVPLALRAASAAGLAGLRTDPRLIHYFAEDHASVFSPLLRRARLEGADWIALLPSLSPTGRAILRHRRDLPAEVEDALTHFGTSDFVIEGAVTAPAPAIAEVPPQPAAPQSEEGPSQIRELVDRIEAFQRHREEEIAHAPADAAVRAETFRWETGVEGVLLWVDGAPRGPLVGQSIAIIAGQGYGVDGQAAGAFHKRAPFRDARFTVVGDGPASGGWRMSGVPFFDIHRGNFLGYRGTARRPRFDEVAPSPGDGSANGLFGSDLAPDALRQLVHELRTPLNAIIGFAEMIEGQYMGPAGARYRGRATDIVDQARRLLGAVDDLDTAARIETSRLDLSPAQVDIAAMLERLSRACTPDREGVAIAVEPNLPPAAIEPAAAERMISRLLAATIGLAASNEVIDAGLSTGAAGGRPLVRLHLGRPQSIAGQDEMQLLHPGYSPEGDWPGAPSLGLGFALRLVRKLAEAAGGSLDISDDAFVLAMPAAAEALPADAGEGQG